MSVVFRSYVCVICSLPKDAKLQIMKNLDIEFGRKSCSHFFCQCCLNHVHGGCSNIFVFSFQTVIINNLSTYDRALTSVLFPLPSNKQKDMLRKCKTLLLEH